MIQHCDWTDYQLKVYTRHIHVHTRAYMINRPVDIDIMRKSRQAKQATGWKGSSCGLSATSVRIYGSSIMIPVSNLPVRMRSWSSAHVHSHEYMHVKVLVHVYAYLHEQVQVRVQLQMLELVHVHIHVYLYNECPCVHVHV